jgi:N-acetylmuramic acid 6-phosphate etherase
MTLSAPRIDYWAVVFRSLRIVWDRKFLWFFGFFASVNGGTVLNWTAEGRPWLRDYVTARLDLMVVVVAGGVVVWLALFLMNLVSRGALIAGASIADRGADAALGQAWSAGLSVFPRMLALVAVALVAFLAVSAICAAPIILSLGGGVPGIVIALVIAAALAVPYLACVFLLAFTITYAERAVVLENAGVLDALRAGWGLARDFFWTSMVVWLIMLLSSFVFTVGLVVALLVLAVPFVLIGLANLTTALLLGIPAGLLFLCPVVGAFGAYQYVVWTLVYRGLASGRGAVGGVRGEGPPAPEVTPLPVPGVAPPSAPGAVPAAVPGWAAPRRDMSAMGALLTERRNPRSVDIDTMTALELVDLLNSEDRTVAAAVGAERERIAAAVEMVVDRFRRGGRLIYAGAGTSGRLGVLDAAECPPSFGTDPDMVQGLVAGGYDALVRAKEGAEDDAAAGADDVRGRGVGADDVLVGIATSGVTPYVVGALKEARNTGAATIILSCTPDPVASVAADIAITPLVGPEVVTGSTRLKAGTATKLVLNTITTSAMILLGKTYENLMVDLTATCDKLRDRACRIIVETTGAGYEEAADLIARAGGSVKTAIVMKKAGLDRADADALLAESGGFVRRALSRHAEE